MTSGRGRRSSSSTVGLSRGEPAIIGFRLPRARIKWVSSSSRLSKVASSRAFGMRSG